MTQLSVNVNKLATLRNSRGKNLPDVLAFSEKILELGVGGITVHPRPDGRHIRTQDVLDINVLVTRWKQRGAKIEFNVEGYPSIDFLEFMKQVQPDQITLVPDPPEALTSNSGWALAQNEDFLIGVVKALKGFSRVSLFVEPAKFTSQELLALERIRPDRIELYTELYADAFHTGQKDEVAKILKTYQSVAESARTLKIGINAGHDLNQKNLRHFLAAIPWVDEVSIGHALFCEALEQGISTTIRSYQAILTSL